MTGTVLAVVVGIAAGVVAGVAFFGGLAATVRRLPDHPRPTGLLVGSLLGRLAVVVGILVALGVWGAVPLLCGAGGLLATRVVLLRRAAGGDRQWT